MFNFNVLNKAMSDPEVSDSEFRLLYLIVNTMSMKNTNELTMYNGYLMDKLNLCERQVRRLTTSLDKKGYITKINNGNSKKRTGNIIRLMGDKNVPPIESKDDTNWDKNVPPNNTSTKKYNNSRQVSSQTSNSTCKKSEYKSEGKMENELNEERTYTSKENNAYVDKCLSRFDTMLHYLYTIKDRKMYDSYTNDILRFFEGIDQTRFTEKQRELITKKCERWAKIAEGKGNYFNSKSENTENKSEDESVSMEPETEDDADAEHISTDEETNLNAGTEETAEANLNLLNDPAPRRQPKSKEEIREWVLKQCEKYPDYASWERNFDAKLEKEFTSDWENNPYAATNYNICAGIADKYFKEHTEEDDDSIDYLLKASEEIETAPWEETHNSTKRKMSEEEWRKKCNDMLHRMKLAEQNKA